MSRTPGRLTIVLPRGSIAVLAVTVTACVGLPPMAPSADGSDTSASAGSTTAVASTGADSESDGMPPCQSDADCDDAIFCNGAETCDSTVGCAPGVSPCLVEAACDENAATCATDCALAPDADGDRYDAVECGGEDCDDLDPAINPGQDEVCDARDIDEDCDPTTFGVNDVDDDGLTSAQCCNGDVCGTDCDEMTAGPGLGTWANCSACGDVCGARRACIEGACAPARRVFATSIQYDGNLGGLSGADGMCQAHADAAVLGGSFSAFMVDGTEDLDRLEHPAVPFVRIDGEAIATDWDDLLDGTIDAPIDIDEFGAAIEGNAWTGLVDVVLGDPDPDLTCSSWTYGGRGCLEDMPCGGAGESGMTDEHWDGYFVFHCEELFRLYCFEQ